ncbi:MAG: hypothetical protein WC593_08225 [Methanoregula sp.]
MEIGLTIELYLVMALIFCFGVMVKMNLNKLTALMLSIKVAVSMNMTATIAFIGGVARVEAGMPFHLCCNQ